MTLVGVFTGLYQLPLDVFIQIASPKERRGQIIAAGSFLSFLGVLFASLLLYLVSEVFGLRADKGFSIIAVLTLLMSAVISYRFFDYFTRFVGKIWSKIYYHVDFLGLEQVPKLQVQSTPSIFVCPHTLTNDLLLLLSSQSRRMRFFFDKSENEEGGKLRKIYRFLRVRILETEKKDIRLMRKALRKGISICILVEGTEMEKEVERIRESSLYQKLNEEFSFPLIPVCIEKEERKKKVSFFRRFTKKFRRSAVVSFGGE